MADLNELNTHAELPTEDQEYIDKMVAKADGNAPTAQAPDVEEVQGEEDTENIADTEEESPAWLPEKFKSPEELAKAYSELEKKLGETPEDKREDLDDTPPEPMDYQSLTTEYWEDGQLSDKSYENLEKMGIPKHIVDAHIAGQNAVVNEVQNSVFKEVGGEAQYREMMTWAQENLSESESAIYDQSVNSNSLDQTLYAVKGLHARYASEVGVEPTLVQGDSTPSSTGAYASAAEVKRDMSDRRYSTDPAFREQVARKLAKSNVF
jgi:hypothetical protein